MPWRPRSAASALQGAGDTSTSAPRPTAAEAKGDPFNPQVTPVKLEMHFEVPANKWRQPIRVSWYQGGAMPESPAELVQRLAAALLPLSDDYPLPFYLVGK